MQNHRRAVQVSNLYPSTHLSGISPLLPPGYFWHVVIYRLHGGQKAQSSFYKQCIKECQEKLGIIFSTRDTLFIPEISYQGDLKKMQPKYQTWKINLVYTKTNEYIHSSFTHISLTLVFPRDKEENLITSLSSPSINYFLHSPVFNKHSISTTLINNYIKSQKSSSPDILKYKGHSKSKVNSKVCVLILKYLDLTIF